MANNPYVNKVIYGNQTLIDTTGDTAVASDVASGKTFHSATGEQLTGTKPAPTSITPSNASPVSLSSSGEYAPTESGYAIKQYTNVDPNPSGGGTGTYHITNTNDARIFKSEGWIVPDRTEITPSNSSPVSLQRSKNYYIESSSNGGYAIASYESVDPSSSGFNWISYPSNTIAKFNSRGTIVPSVNEITPNNGNPVSLSSGSYYKTLSNGYAIESYNSVNIPTSSTTGVNVETGIYEISGAGTGVLVKSVGSSIVPSASGTYFNSGYRYMSTSGYAYSSRPESYTTYTDAASTGTSSTSHSFSLTSGKVYLVLLFNSSGNALSSTRFDNASCTGGTLSKMMNLFSENAYGAGTFYILKATSSSVTITHAYAHRVKVIIAN